jgi:hypothetical protein
MPTGVLCRLLFPTPTGVPQHPFQVCEAESSGVAMSEGRSAFLLLMCGEVARDGPGYCRSHRQPEPEVQADEGRYYGIHVHGDLLPFSPAVRHIAS